MKYADEYFNNCKKIVTRLPELIMQMVRYNIFARKDGMVIGANKAVNFIKENTHGPLRILGLKDGDNFSAGQPVLICEGNCCELLNLETTNLGFLSYSGAAANMAAIVKEADGIPVIDMSARHYPWQFIEEVALSAYFGGAAGTSTQAGCDYVHKWYPESRDNFSCYASLPHAMAAIVAQMAEKENIFPSVMASLLFQKTFPEKNITVLVDYEGRELDVTKQAFELLGDKLFAVRLDTHGGRQMQGTISNENNYFQNRICYLKEKSGKLPRTLEMEFLESTPEFKGIYGKFCFGNGVTIESVFHMREFLDSIGAKKTKIVVSSGFNRDKVRAFRMTNAPMDFIGTGSWPDFMMFTADITHVLEKGQWVRRTKVGREHGDGADLQVLYERA